MIVITGYVKGFESQVTISVTDLDAFVHAGPDADVVVSKFDGVDWRQFVVTKEKLHGLRLQHMNG